MPLAPRAASDPATEDYLIQLHAAVDGPTVDGPSHLGADFDHPPIANADNHFREIMAAHPGQPSIAVQNATHGAPASGS
jgi:hypothetical protein